MQTSTLHAFLAGKIAGAALAADVAGAIVPTGSDVFRVHLTDDLDEDVPVTSAHLVRLCDAVLAGELPADALATIAFGMIAADHLVWDTEEADGERVGAALFDWSAPEVNWPLNRRTVAKFRQRLLTGEDTFTAADGLGRPPPRRLVWQRDHT